MRIVTKVALFCGQSLLVIFLIVAFNISWEAGGKWLIDGGRPALAWRLPIFLVLLVVLRVCVAVTFLSTVALFEKEPPCE